MVSDVSCESVRPSFFMPKFYFNHFSMCILNNGPVSKSAFVLVRDRLVNQRTQLAVLVQVPGGKELSEVDHDKLLLRIDPVA